MQRQVLVLLVLFFFGLVLVPGIVDADKPEEAGKPVRRCATTCVWDETGCMTGRKTGPIDSTRQFLTS